MPFTNSEFPGRTFKSIRELEELQKERDQLQERLRKNTTRTPVERVETPEDPESDPES